MNYELHSNHVLRSDGAFIPKSEGNRDYQEYLEWEKKGNKPSDPPKPPKTVPSVVSRFQGLAALMQAGLLHDIEAFMADPLTDPFDRLAWQSIQEFRRTSPTVARIGAIFNFTEEQVDDLFRFAATVEA